MPRSGSRPFVWIVASLLLVVGIAVVVVLLPELLHRPGGGDVAASPQTAPVASAPPPAMPGASAPATPGRTAASGPAPSQVPPRPPSTEPDAEDRGFERALRWSGVDLDALRQEMPGNLYWEMGAPTDDPEVIEARARERALWNERWGQVQSGNASVEEIHAYYAHRQQLSTDYLEFASRMLDRYRDTLPESDVGLLELSVRMHHTRLQSLPRDLAEALERKERQDALREAWLRDEERFAPEGAAER